MKYVTFSYDDNSALDLQLLSILNRYGARCTFNLNSGMRVPGKLTNFFLGSRRMLSLEELAGMLSGTCHEIAGHGQGHKNLLKLSPQAMQENIRRDKEALETVSGRQIRGFIFPYGAYSKETTAALKGAGFTYARTTCSTHSFLPPEEFLEWHPTCHHNDKELFQLAEDFVRLNTEEDRIFYVWGHAWEYGVFKNWDRLEKLLEILTKDPEIRYVTNQEFVEKYTILKT